MEGFFLPLVASFSVTLHSELAGSVTHQWLMERLEQTLIVPKKVLSLYSPF